MKKAYQIVTRAERESAAVIEQFCQANGQILLPLLNLIQSASQVVETVVHEIGLQTLETILKLSAEEIAGPRTPGEGEWRRALARVTAGTSQNGRPSGAGAAAAPSSQDRRGSEDPGL